MPLPQLNAAILDSGPIGPNVRYAPAPHLPERVLQFGEGNFLRAFVDWFIHRLNQRGLFNGKVVVVQPIANGLAGTLNVQDGLYTLLLRGLQAGQVVDEREIISSISRGINPYADYAAFLQCAENPDLRLIVSNTTEAGIAFNPADQASDAPPASFPGKLTAFLHRRFVHFAGAADKGFILLPCELIERNGTALKAAVLQTAAHWNLASEFTQWIENANHFTNTLVDRIVTGYPKTEHAEITTELGYEDALLDAGEVFHFWAIEGDARLAEELPLEKIGMNVVWTNDLTPYRDRKVRILNGAHTMTVLAGYLAGKDTVRACVEDELIARFMRAGIYEEIIPTLDLPAKELDAFAAAVTERFANPFIEHYLLSIALNSTSKFKARVLPSIEEYRRRKGALPRRLTFSLAALLAFYRGIEVRGDVLIGARGGEAYKIQDDKPVLELFARLWQAHDGSASASERLVHQVLARTEIWGANLADGQAFPSFAAAVTQYLQIILTQGAREALRIVA